MRDGQTRPSVYRFGDFELDTRSGELRKNGTRIRLQDQPLQILLLMLEHAGEVMTREQIQNKLGPPAPTSITTTPSTARCGNYARRWAITREIRGSSRRLRGGGIVSLGTSSRRCRWTRS